jgi:hypothetical protein
VSGANRADDTVTAAQHRLMHLLWKGAGVTDRESRLWITGLWLGCDIDSSRSLTKNDAAVVIDKLQYEGCACAVEAYHEDLF